MKKLKKIVLILILSITHISTCYAAFSGGVPTVATGNNGGGGGDGSGNHEPPNYTLTYGGSGGNNVNYSCYFEYSINTSYNITIDGFNQENQSIIGNDSPTPTEPIIAGTAIGISIVETKSISWDVTKVTLTKTRKGQTRYRCRVRNTNCSSACRVALKNNCNNCPLYIWGVFDYRRSNTCQEIPGGDETVAATEEEKATCQKKAENWVRSQIGSWPEIPTYEVKLKNSNYINPTGNENEIVKIIDKPDTSCNYGNKSITCKFNYSPKTVCINRKTSKITYTDKDGCDSDSIQIRNENGHWHYFTPLNAKSTDTFYLSIVNNGQSGLQSPEFCRAAIDYNSNYVELIKDRNNKKLSTNKVSAKNAVAGGCYLGVDVNIPLVQKFYNEETTDDKIIFKGFNFYYRPIDINNPFPNGIASDSYWSEWGKSRKAVPNLSESFLKNGQANVTYITRGINASAIREYNDKYPYTDWSNMNIKGASSVIGSNEIPNTQIERIVSTNSFYSLGCGPANENWEECKR